MPGLCGMHRYRHQKKRTPFYLYFGNNIQVHTQPTYPGITRVNPSFCILHLYRWYNMNVKVLIQSLVPCVLSPHVSAAVPLLLWTDEQSPSPWYVVLPIYIYIYIEVYTLVYAKFSLVRARYVRYQVSHTVQVQRYLVSWFSHQPIATTRQSMVTQSRNVRSWYRLDPCV